MRTHNLVKHIPFSMRSLVSLSLAAMLVACGGGSSNENPAAPWSSGSVAPSTGGSTSGSTSGGSTGGTTGVAQKCSSNNPYLKDEKSPTTPGTLADEKAWLRGYMNDAYLWYNEMPNVDASAALYSNDRTTGFYDSIEAYFKALKTTATTASGAKRDKFSFVYPTKDWNDMSQSGKEMGYGIQWFFSPTVPRNITVAYVEPNSPAAKVGIQRGDLLVTVDGASGESNTQSDINTLNLGLFPQNAGSHNFVFSRKGVTLASQSITAGEIIKQPVLQTQTLDVNGAKVGYMVFNDHIAPAEQQLIDGIAKLKADKVTDLVLDLRYNGGGYLYIASELSYMIAGAARTDGKVFQKLQYNDKRKDDNAEPATGFYNMSCILSDSFKCTSEKPLPTLDLGRVFVLTSKGTCSASEAIINGLRGIGVDVQLIGNTTCGKPYGFTARDNCGISYFPIEFEGRNAMGRVVNSDGEAANCAAKDDYTHLLGDQNEGMLAAALYKREKGVCKPVSSAMRIGGNEGVLHRAPIRENAIFQQRK